MTKSSPPLRVLDESGNVINPVTHRLKFPDFYGLARNGIETQFNPFRLAQNFITNPNAWQDTSGWSRYEDGAVAAPVDGDNGAPAGAFELNRTTVGAEILRDGAAFEIVKDAVNRQGHGVSTPFTIDPVDQGETLDILISHKNGAGYATDDIAVFIYDITNANLITPVSNGLVASTIGTTTRLTFMAATDSVSYRLILHVTSTNASAYDLFFSHARVGLPFAVIPTGTFTFNTSTINTSTTFVVPAGVEFLWISGSGGGGGGGTGGDSGTFGASTNGGGGGGGGGGSLKATELMDVSPGETLTITLGAGGSGGSNLSNRDTGSPNIKFGNTGGSTTVAGTFGTLLFTGGTGGGNGQEVDGSVGGNGGFWRLDGGLVATSGGNGGKGVNQGIDGVQQQTKWGFGAAGGVSKIGLGFGGGGGGGGFGFAAGSVGANSPLVGGVNGINAGNASANTAGGGGGGSGAAGTNIGSRFDGGAGGNGGSARVIFSWLT